MITSLIEGLELSNFGHMTTSTIEFEACGTILMVTWWTESKTSKPFFQNISILRRPRVAYVYKKS